MKQTSSVSLALLALVLLNIPRTLNSQTNANLQGTWQANEGVTTITLTLNAGGTGKLDGAGIKYTVKDNVLIVDEGGVVNRYAYQLNGNVLTLSGGDLQKPMVFERQGASSSSGLGARRAQAAAAGTAPSNPAGAWETQGPNGVIRLVLKPDGTGTFGGGPVRWQFDRGILSLTGPNNNTVMYNAALTQDSLTLSGGNLTQPVIFRASASEQSSAGPKIGSDGKSHEGLVGQWQGPAGIVEVKADGTMLIKGVPYRYSIQGDILTLIGNDGSLPVPFRLNGDNLTMTLSGQLVNLRRIAAQGAGQLATPAGTGADLVGKWCYFSSFSATSGGGSMTDECFTINANGTYQYHREGSISAYSPGIYGGTASQTDDTGTVQVSGPTLTVISRTKGTSTYTLEKRNHPKTGDPMLCLDGRCFVTYYQRPPWR
jgi:hypothetical protein